METATCQICGKVLTNADSIKRGVGEECFAQDVVNRALDRVQDAVMKAAFGVTTTTKRLQALFKQGEGLSCQDVYVSRQEGRVVIHRCTVEEVNDILERAAYFLRSTKFRVSADGVIRYITGEALISQATAWTQEQTEVLLAAAETKIRELSQEIHTLSWVEDAPVEHDRKVAQLQAQRDRILEIRSHYCLNRRGEYVASRQWGWAAGHGAQIQFAAQAQQNLNELAALVA